MWFWFWFWVWHNCVKVKLYCDSDSDSDSHNCVTVKLCCDSDSDVTSSVSQPPTSQFFTHTTLALPSKNVWCLSYNTPCVSTYAPVAPPLHHMVYHFLFFTHPIIALSQKTRILMSIFFLQHPVLSMGFFCYLRYFCAQCVPPKFIQIKVFHLSDCKVVWTPKNAPALQKTWTKTKNNM